MSDSLAINGLPEFEAMLKDLPVWVSHEIVRKAIRAAGEMVVAAIKARANFGPYSEGERGLKGSIKLFEYPLMGRPFGIVKPDRRRGGGGRHAHLVEFPVAPHLAKYYGRPFQHPGTRAQPFFQPAVDAVEGEAVELMKKTVSDAVATYWENAGGAPK